MPFENRGLDNSTSLMWEMGVPSPICKKHCNHNSPTNTHMLIPTRSNSKAFSWRPCHNPCPYKNLLLQLSQVNTFQDSEECLKYWDVFIFCSQTVRLTHIYTALTKKLLSVWYCSLHLYHQGCEWSASNNLILNRLPFSFILSDISLIFNWCIDSLRWKFLVLCQIQ